MMHRTCANSLLIIAAYQFEKSSFRFELHALLGLDDEVRTEPCDTVKPFIIDISTVDGVANLARTQS